MKVFLKTSTLTLVLLVVLLVMTIGNECFAVYNYGATAVNSEKVSKVGCGTCWGIFYPQDKDKHVCNGRAVARSTTRTSSYQQTRSRNTPSVKLPPIKIPKVVAQQNSARGNKKSSWVKNVFAIFHIDNMQNTLIQGPKNVSVIRRSGAWWGSPNRASSYGYVRGRVR